MRKFWCNSKSDLQRVLAADGSRAEIAEKVDTFPTGVVIADGLLHIVPARTIYDLIGNVPTLDERTINERIKKAGLWCESSVYDDTISFYCKDSAGDPYCLFDYDRNNGMVISYATGEDLNVGDAADLDDILRVAVASLDALSGKLKGVLNEK